MKAKIISATVSVGVVTKPLKKKQYKLKKKYRKQPKSKAGVRIDLVVELIDQFRLTENVIVAGLGNFRVIRKNKVNNTMELKQLEMFNTSINNFTVTGEVMIGSLGFTVGEGSALT